MYPSVLYLCAIVLVCVESFPLDEDVCENNNYFGNLQAYNSDELELLEDACPAPRDFNRREIPVRFRKPVSEYEKNEDRKQNEDESNESNKSMVPKDRASKYSQESYQTEEKFCQRPKTHHKFNSFHQKSKRKYSEYDSDSRKFAGAKSYRIPPFETFYKSYSQYGGPGMKELNTEDVDEIVDVKKQSQTKELVIKEEMIDKPTDVEEINVERVVQETNENSADNNEDKQKQDDEDNHESSGESDETVEVETGEKDMNVDNEKIILKKQKINDDKSTTENTRLVQDRATINV
ncbi:hypothetical protein CBL_00065 [Carabus blaptoides fortunei]